MNNCITARELWTEYFLDLPTPEHQWFSGWDRNDPRVVQQAFEEIARWRKRKPDANTFSVAKMITARCRLVSTGERKLKVSSEPEALAYEETWGKE